MPYIWASTRCRKVWMLQLLDLLHRLIDQAQNECASHVMLLQGQQMLHSL